jgi:cellulose biosynthesis protein BcsQ
MLTIAIANSKPGTSKTTSAVWLAAAFHGAAR